MTFSNRAFLEEEERKIVKRQSHKGTPGKNGGAYKKIMGFAVAPETRTPCLGGGACPAKKVAQQQNHVRRQQPVEPQEATPPRMEENRAIRKRSPIAKVPGWMEEHRPKK